MEARDVDPPVDPGALADQGAAEALLGETPPQLSEILRHAEETARSMLEAEQALGLVRQQFERTEDPKAQAGSSRRAHPG